MFGKKKQHKETMRLILENQAEIMAALAGMAAHVNHQASRELLNKQASKTFVFCGKFYPRTN